MMEFSCFSNSPNGPTTYTHTHTCNARTRIPTASCSPSTRHHVSALLFVLFNRFFFCFAWIFFCGFYTQHTEWKRERERERKRQRSCKACYVFNLSTICKRCTIQGSQLSLVPPSSIPVLTKFTVSFTVLHVVYWGHCMNLPKNREKKEWKTIVSMNRMFYGIFKWFLVMINIR